MWSASVVPMDDHPGRDNDSRPSLNPEKQSLRSSLRDMLRGSHGGEEAPQLIHSTFPPRPFAHPRKKALSSSSSSVVKDRLAVSSVDKKKRRKSTGSALALNSGSAKATAGVVSGSRKLAVLSVSSSSRPSSHTKLPSVNRSTTAAPVSSVSRSRRRHKPAVVRKMNPLRTSKGERSSGASPFQPASILIESQKEKDPISVDDASAANVTVAESQSLSMDDGNDEEEAKLAVVKKVPSRVRSVNAEAVAEGNDHDGGSSDEVAATLDVWLQASADDAFLHEQRKRARATSANNAYHHSTRPPTTTATHASRTSRETDGQLKSRTSVASSAPLPRRRSHQRRRPRSQRESAKSGVDTASEDFDEDDDNSNEIRKGQREMNMNGVSTIDGDFLLPSTSAVGRGDFYEANEEFDDDEEYPDGNEGVDRFDRKQQQQLRRRRDAGTRKRLRRTSKIDAAVTAGGLNSLPLGNYSSTARPSIFAPSDHCNVPEDHMRARQRFAGRADDDRRHPSPPPSDTEIAIYDDGDNGDGGGGDPHHDGNPIDVIDNQRDPLHHDPIVPLPLAKHQGHAVRWQSASDFHTAQVRLPFDADDDMESVIERATAAGPTISLAPAPVGQAASRLLEREVADTIPAFRRFKNENQGSQTEDHGGTKETANASIEQSVVDQDHPLFTQDEWCQSLEDQQVAPVHVPDYRRGSSLPHSASRRPELLSGAAGERQETALTAARTVDATSAWSHNYAIAKEDLSIGEIIGQGHYSIVRKAVWLDATDVVVKQLRPLDSVVGRRKTQSSAAAPLNADNQVKNHPLSNGLMNGLSGKKSTVDDGYDVPGSLNDDDDDDGDADGRQPDRQLTDTLPEAYPAEKAQYSRRFMGSFWREVRILCSLRHPHVVLCLGAVLDPRGPMIVTEFFPLGTLFEVLHGRIDRSLPFRSAARKLARRTRAHGLLELSSRLRMAADTAAGMLYLHRQRPVAILHRDLKSTNILISSDYRAKVSDFGLARAERMSSSSDATGALKTGDSMSRISLLDVTIQAPEVLASRLHVHTKKSDVFSFGLLLWEVYFRQVPFAEMEPRALVLAVLRHGHRPTIGNVLDDGRCCQLMRRCWHEDPNERPLFDEIAKSLRELSRK